MNGGDLRFHISRKTFTEEAVRFWIAELGCALRYIHKQGIIHRDVKPDNVLLDSEGHVHLADFVSGDSSEERLLLTRTRMLRLISPLGSLSQANLELLRILRQRFTKELDTHQVQIGGRWVSCSMSAYTIRSGNFMMQSLTTLTPPAAAVRG